MKTKPLLLTLVMAMLLVSSSCEKTPGNHEKSDALNAYCSIVPEGWDCQMILDHFNPDDIPANTGDPLAIIKYTNTNRVFTTSEDLEVHPSLILNIYSIRQQEDLIQLIKSQQLYSWCIPAYYGETDTHFVLTSPCFINGGCFTEEANSSIEDLHKALESFIQKNDYGLIPQYTNQ
jgi:hypothetical protein